MPFIQSSRRATSKMHLSDAPTLGLVGLVVVVLLIVAFAVFNTFAAASSPAVEIAHEPAAEEAPAPVSSLFVHVAGCVVSPGVYEVDDGARVGDCIDAAGGFSDDAARDAQNLARKVEDGEQIVVPAQSAPDDAAGGEGAADAPAGEVQASTGLVNINTATSDQLESLPGIGGATAQKIIADRTASGTFKTKEDLMRVSGIGEKKFEALRDLICV